MIFFFISLGLILTASAYVLIGQFLRGDLLDKPMSDDWRWPR